MTKFLSTVFSWIIAPDNWLIALLIWRLIAKSPVVRKRLNISLLILIVVFGNDFLYNKVVTAWQPKPVTIAEGVSYDAGIVLGGISSFDKYKRGYMNTASDRFIETCVLYKTGKIKKIIVSGGSNHKGGPKDARFQYQKMVELGIPPADIIVEDSSTNTFENASFSKAKLETLKLTPPFVLITSAMHVRRAEMVFKKAGLPVIPYPADYRVFEKKFGFTDYFVPHLGTVFGWGGFLKESVGLMGISLLKG